MRPFARSQLELGRAGWISRCLEGIVLGRVFDIGDAVHQAQLVGDAVLGSLPFDQGSSLVNAVGLDPGHDRPALLSILAVRLEEHALSCARELKVLERILLRLEVVKRIQRVGCRGKHLVPLLCRGEGIGGAVDLVGVADAVAVAVGQARVKAELLLLAIREAIAGRSHHIKVSGLVGLVGRVGAAEVLIEVDKAVTILVASGVRDTIIGLKPVGHAIAVDIIHAVHGGGIRVKPVCNARIDGIAAEVLPARMCKVLDGLAAIIEAVTAHEALALLGQADQDVVLSENVVDVARHVPDADFVNADIVRPGRLIQE